MRTLLLSLLITAPLLAQKPGVPLFKTWDKNSDGKLAPSEIPE